MYQRCVISHTVVAEFCTAVFQLLWKAFFRLPTSMIPSIIDGASETSAGYCHRKYTDCVWCSNQLKQSWFFSMLVFPQLRMWTIAPIYHTKYWWTLISSGVKVNKEGTHKLGKFAKLVRLQEIQSILPMDYSVRVNCGWFAKLFHPVFHAQFLHKNRCKWFQCFLGSIWTGETEWEVRLMAQVW